MAEKGKAIQIRTSNEEYEIIEEKAKKVGLTVSAYIRLVALQSEIKIVLKEEKE